MDSRLVVAVEDKEGSKFPVLELRVLKCTKTTVPPPKTGHYDEERRLIFSLVF